VEGGRVILVDEDRPPPSVASWRISPSPRVVIGSAAADEPSESAFTGQVTDVRRLSDGSIAVVDFGAIAVRVFDDEGRFLHRVGRAGEGPGEFRAVAWARECKGGRLFAPDYVTSVVKVFDGDGEFRREARTESSSLEMGLRFRVPFGDGVG